MHLFDYLDSGNGYKVRLLLAQLGIDYGWTSRATALGVRRHCSGCSSSSTATSRSSRRRATS
jgi:hypothetical protein